MEAKQEESVLPATEGENAERAPPTDPILLQVLIDIRASLQRLENRLVSDQPPRDQHQIASSPPSVENVVPEIGDEEIEKTSETGDHEQSLKEELVQDVNEVEKEEDASVHETIQSESSAQDSIRGVEQESQIYYYKISSDEQKVMEKSWDGLALLGFSTIKFGPQHVVCPSFPDMVSDNTWNYYKPYREESDTESGNTVIRTCFGQGRPNFLPAWELESVNFDSDEKVENLLRVPYSSLPPIGNLGMAFTAQERDMLLELFGGLFTLPPDWRLNLEFQSHVLRREEKSNLRTDRFGRYAIEVRLLEGCYRTLDAIGGSFKVQEIVDGRSWIYKYDRTGQQTVTASDLEMLRAFPATTMKVTRGWKPNIKSDINAFRSKRIIIIEGFADVFKRPLWDRQTFSGVEFLDNPPSDLLFELHTTCAIRANDRLSIYSPEIFHINWMDLRRLPENESLPTSIHKSWQRRQLGSRELSLGVVAGSLQYFCVFDDRFLNSTEWWTLLILAPRGEPRIEHEDGMDLWMVIIKQIHSFMAKASGSWVELADEFENLLVLNDTKGILLEDEKFSQSQKLFWMLNKIDEVLPMITDEIVQWNWFRDSNNFEKLAADHMVELKDGRIVSGLAQRREFQDKLVEIEKILPRLEDSKLRFQAIRERARSLRDGIFSLTSVKEARDARVPGENVKLLTYVTIFYLPLAFCSSLWAINDMFGTGTSGFAIITVVLALGTYVAVFGLLHPTTKKDAIEAIKKSLPFSWITGKTKQETNPRIRSRPMKLGKVKVKEKERMSSRLQSNDATVEPQHQKKSTLLSRFRKRKVKGREDHEMGDVRAQLDSSNSK